MISRDFWNIPMPGNKTFLFCLLLLLFSTPAQAEKTDVVYLHNGDRITGEAKSLDRGKLEFKTDHMGTVYIEWEDIAEIISTTGQAVELANGQRFYGPLHKPDDSNMMIVSTEQGAISVGTLDVVNMYPVEAGFWDRLDLSASVGFSWDKASSVGKYNLGLSAEYRNPRFLSRADFSSEVTTQQNKDDTARANFSFNHLVFKPGARFMSYFGTMDRNDELGIYMRALAGAGYGWAPIRSNRNWFYLAGGLSVNHEIPNEGSEETNLEAVGMVNYEYYRYTTPERKFTSRLTVFPSVTDFGRWRADFTTDFRFEMFDDLFWVMEFFTNYDSDPISVDASNIDYGVISSVAYKF
jgi:hypothetical protein